MKNPKILYMPFTMFYDNKKRKSNQIISNCILQDANTIGWFMMSQRIILALLFIMVGVYYLLGSNETPIRTKVPDKINIKFKDSASNEEIDAFIKKISEFGFSEVIQRNDVASHAGLRQFNYDINRIYGRDLLKLIKNERIVEKTNFQYGYIAGEFSVRFENYQTDEELLELTTKFSRYEVKVLQRLPFLNGVILTFNDELIEHSAMRQLLLNEVKVTYVQYQIIMGVDYAK